MVKGIVSGVFLFLLLVTFSAVSQTTDELRKKYGLPDAEFFVVRSGITVTARYAANGRACEILIEPKRPLMPDKDHPATMSPETSTKIIDEIVPLSQRGPFIRDITFTGGCSSLRVTDYGDVQITRMRECPPERTSMETSVHIKFKKATCR